MDLSIFKICPHCGKKLFLIHNMEIAMYFGRDEYEFHKDENLKDPKSGKWPNGYEGEEKSIRELGGYSEQEYPDRHIRLDWESFDIFLHGLQNSHGPNLYVSYDDKTIAHISKLERDLQDMLGSWMEPKVKEQFFKRRDAELRQREQERKKKEQERKFDDGKDWMREIDSNLVDNIKKMWIKYDFDFDQVKELIEIIGLGVSDYAFVAWLRDEKNLKTPEDIIAHDVVYDDLKNLKEQWKESQKKDEPKQEPKPPQKKTIREWYWERALTDEEWEKASKSDLSNILGKTLFTLEEAKKAIRETKEWTTEDKPPQDWREVLKEINHFFSIPAPNLDTIDRFLKTKSYPDPLDGVDLNGQSYLDLLKHEEYDIFNEVRDAKNTAFFDADKLIRRYKALSASSDGNCFFNAFSKFLVGDESLATRLRVKVCLGLMARHYTGEIEVKDPDFSFHILKEINRKLPSISSESGYISWGGTDDCPYVSAMLSRLVRVYYKPNITKWNPNSQSYKDLIETGGFAVVEALYRDYKEYIVSQKTYSMDYTIFHIYGNHFVPLQFLEESDIYIEPLEIKIVERGEVPYYDMHITVSKRGQNRDEETHIIGDNWKNDDNNINNEQIDKNPNYLKGVEVEEIFIPNVGADKRDWVGRYNEQDRSIKVKEIRIIGLVVKLVGKNIWFRNRDELGDEVKIEGITERDDVPRSVDS